MSNKNNRLSKNIIANIVGRIWTFLSIFIFVPIYVKLLGVESYGVITFHSVLLAFLAFADAGFAATMNREFAKTEHFTGYRACLLVTFEKIYIVMALSVIVLSAFFAPKIVTAFLDAKDIPFDNLVLYVRMMGIIIAFYFFSSLYQGCLMGLQKQVLANVLSISYNIVKAGLVAIPLLFNSSLEVYFSWQIVVTIIYVITCRIIILKYVDGFKKSRTNFAILRPIWRYTVGMVILAIIYAANTQVDKLTVGNLLPLRDLGLYFMSASVSQVSLMLATPIGMAVFPQLSNLVSLNKFDEMKKVFLKFSYLIAMIVSVVVGVIFVYTYDFINIWQSDFEIAKFITPSTRVLLFGYLFMGIQLMPYYLALANGYTKINIILGVFSIIFIIPSMSMFINEYGFIGATYPWLIINSSSTLVLSAVTIRKFARGVYWNWLLRNTIMPVFVSLFIVFIGAFCFSFFTQGYMTLLYGPIIGLMALWVNIKVYSYYYPEIKENRFFNLLL